MAGYGFVRSELEIKTLTLYVLDYARLPVSFDELLSMVFVDDAINYFNFAEHLNGMIETGHVEVNSDTGTDRYSITQKGMRDLAAIKSSVSGSVLRKAEAAAKKVKEEIARKNFVNVKVLDNGDAYLATGTLSDDSGEVFSFSMSAPNKDTARKLTANFYRNAEKIYNEFLKAILTSDK